jgi:hypothetical protein
VCTSGAPAHGRRRAVVGIVAGGGGGTSVLCAALTHSWLPIIIGASLLGLIIILLGVSLLIPICHGFYPTVENGQFKLRFEKGNSQ